MTICIIWLASFLSCFYHVRFLLTLLRRPCSVNVYVLSGELQFFFSRLLYLQSQPVECLLFALSSILSCLSAHTLPKHSNIPLETLLGNHNIRANVLFVCQLQYLSLVPLPCARHNHGAVVAEHYKIEKNNGNNCDHSDHSKFYYGQHILIRFGMKWK